MIAIKYVENWIRDEFLSTKYHQDFAKRKLGVQSGGEFETMKKKAAEEVSNQNRESEEV
jgi:hypothetical protein